MSKFNYHSTRWRQKREHILKRDGYMCRESRRYGRNVDANVVHHIYPADDYPEWAFEDWNLLSLSNEVHNAMHDRITNELTERGKELQKRHPPPIKNSK